LRNVKYLNKKEIEVFLNKFNTGEFIYKNKGVYRTFKRLNKYAIKELDSPERASFLNARGYRRIHAVVDGESKTMYEHRLVFALFNDIDSLLSFQCIDHIDGDKENNSIDNLRGASIKENTLYAEEMGRFGRTYGKINGMHKLDEHEIEEIRRLYAEGENQYNLSDAFKVSQSHISNIVNNKTRKHG